MRNKRACQRVLFVPAHIAINFSRAVRKALRDDLIRLRIPSYLFKGPLRFLNAKIHLARLVCDTNTQKRANRRGAAAAAAPGTGFRSGPRDQLRRRGRAEGIHSGIIFLTPGPTAKTGTRSPSTLTLTVPNPFDGLFRQVEFIRILHTRENRNPFATAPTRDDLFPREETLMR